jgi:hypothetical protein
MIPLDLPIAAFFPLPGDKTFHLPHGRGDVTVPSGQRGDRADLALEATSDATWLAFSYQPAIRCSLVLGQAHGLRGRIMPSWTRMVMPRSSPCHSSMISMFRLAVIHGANL